MRLFGVTVCALLISLAVNGLLLTKIGNLKAERDEARAEIVLLRQARNADAAAISASQSGRDAAAQTAKEGRDALHEIEKNCADMPDNDFLRNLRGVCIPKENRSADAPRKSNEGLSRTDTATRYDGGK